jgi:ABC-type amino acid transport substrate-binding protein
MQRVEGSRNPYSGLARIRSAGELVAGLDPNNLPFSTAHPTPAGLDHEIAGLVAAELGVALRVYWGVSAHDSYPSHLATKRRCDVILGVMPDDRFGQRVLYSRPYYMASYRQVIKTGADRPGDLEPLAVEAGVAIRGLKGRPVHTYPSTEAILEAVARGREKAGYVISTRGPWLAAGSWPGALEFLPAGSNGTGAQTADRLPVCAAVRKSDADLKAALDQAFGALERSGALAAALARWHIPLDSANDPATGPGPRKVPGP